MTGRGVLVGLVVLLGAAWAGCDDSDGAAAPSTTSSTSAATTATTSAGPCDEAAARSVVEQFFAAFNAADGGLVDRFFAEGDRFQWYSDDPGRVARSGTEGTERDPYERSTLRDYLMAQHRAGDRLALERLADLQVRASDQTASFGLVVTRPDGRSQGKATIDCSTHKLVVVSLGRPAPA